MSRRSRSFRRRKAGRWASTVRSPLSLSGLAHPLLHDAERPAGLVAVDQHKPEEVEHPVGWGRLPVPSEADRGGKRQGGLGLLHDIWLLREIDRDARPPFRA